MTTSSTVRAGEQSTVRITCRVCDKAFEFTVNTDDAYNFRSGRYHIQDCFPYLTDGERELFITQTCEKCFEEIFADEKGDADNG